MPLYLQTFANLRALTTSGAPLPLSRVEGKLLAAASSMTPDSTYPLLPAPPRGGSVLGEEDDPSNGGPDPGKYAGLAGATGGPVVGRPRWCRIALTAALREEGQDHSAATAAVARHCKLALRTALPFAA